MKILVFADSRGQHKPAQQAHLLFGERLVADDRLKVDLCLCPMKWTTTLDFLEQFTQDQLSSYGAVVLYTGIVDWSPRRSSSARQDLYDNSSPGNSGNLFLNTRDYSKKVVNNKKRIFDEVFGEAEMRRHFDAPFDVEFEGEKTANMYGIDMARESLLPRLKLVPNLIFISSNRFVEGWRGDYRRERPANISLTHAYSDLFSQELPPSGVVDLRAWDVSDVKKFTCDNLHLTKAGSDYIFESLMKRLEIKPESKSMTIGFDGLAKEFQGIKPIERIVGPKKQALLDRVGRKSLATLIIGLRLAPSDPGRLQNLSFLLTWLDHHYSDLFDILLVEQDSEPRLDIGDLKCGANVRHEYIYNPEEYNRGWGYNVAVKHFAKDADVVALMDTDVLTGSNFVREILDCHDRFEVVSPYQNIYYTDESEAQKVMATRRIDHLADASKVKNPVTVAGGIVIFRRSTYLSVKGFEQYVGYGCEDRALDVTLFNHVDPSRIRIAPFAYVHLHHPTDTGARARFKQIYEHLTTHYGCKYVPGLKPYDFIHQKCEHVGRPVTLRMMIERSGSFADVNLYKGEGPLSINGQLPKKPELPSAKAAIFPPDGRLLDHARREIYETAPPPDSEDLALFYNAYRGQRCFIIGNGPSLNRHDLSALAGEYTFGVNSFYYKTRETGFMPYFYVVEDSSVMKENIDEIRKFDAPFKFFPTNYRNLHPKTPNTFFFRMNRGFYEKSSPNYVVPRFSTDASSVLYCGQSVTYINLQLAYFMGFTEVYLIGMDFSYVIPESHARTGDVLLSDTDDENHFHKDYFGKGKTWKDPKLDRVALNYRQAKLAYEATGRRIFNATIGGSLEVFDRVDYNALLGLSRPTGESNEKSFASANRLVREHEYAKALSAYVDLSRADGQMFLYKRAAVDAFMRAAQAGQPCNAADTAFIRGLMFNL